MYPPIRLHKLDQQSNSTAGDQSKKIRLISALKEMSGTKRGGHPESARPEIGCRSSYTMLEPHAVMKCLPSYFHKKDLPSKKREDPRLGFKPRPLGKSQAANPLRIFLGYRIHYEADTMKRMDLQTLRK